MANLEIILQELRDFRRENSETLKEIKDNIKSESNRIDDAKQWIVKAEERLQHVEEATQELLALQKLFDDRLLDLEGHLRGKNIRIHGVKEGAEDCAKSMIEFVDALLRIQLELPISLHFLIEKAHRAPASRPPQDSTRRAIVVRFKSFRMKYEILKRAWQKKGFEYEGSRVFLDHDYAPEALTKRQEYAEAENVLTERNICFQTPFPARSRAFDEGEIRIANSAEEATTGMARRGLQVTMLKPKESGLEKTKCLTLQDPPKASTPPCVPLTFSSPIVKPTAAGPPSFSPSAGFTFGTPVAKLGPTPTTAAGASVEAASSASSAPVFGLGDKFKKPEGAWDCDVCLVQNKAADVQCVVCEAAKPGASMEPKAFSGVFKASADWTCDVCLTPNKLSDTKCVCCAAPQPNSSPKSIDSKQTPAPSVGLESSSKNTSTTTTSTAAAEAATGFGSVFSKPTGTWDCDTCLVLNKPDAVKCVACETAKPGTGLKPSLTLPSAFSAVKTVSTPAEPAATGFTGFGDKFKKPEGSWECDTCMVQNKAEDTKCVACTSAKPGASAEAASSASSAPVFGLGDKFKKPEGAWDCDVCQAQNKAADVQCVACQAAKPGASVEPKGLDLLAQKVTPPKVASHLDCQNPTPQPPQQQPQPGLCWAIQVWQPMRHKGDLLLDHYRQTRSRLLPSSPSGNQTTRRTSQAPRCCLTTRGNEEPQVQEAFPSTSPVRQQNSLHWLSHSGSQQIRVKPSLQRLPNPPSRSDKMLQRVEASSLEEAVASELQTTLPACLPLEREPLAPLLLPPTPPWHPNQEVDSSLTKLQLILGQINPSLPLQPDKKPSLGTKSGKGRMDRAGGLGPRSTHLGVLMNSYGKTPVTCLISLWFAPHL